MSSLASRNKLHGVVFGVSHSQAYRCYSVVLQKGAAGVPQARTTPLGKCDVI
ncbi:hypothetical protein [Streptomyces sp. NPDC052693]|uniref:hypothetical protein n=1 Tax=Streptomyces sp. NPDC052693 TaxID=3155814 RepID=UPI0034464E0C